MVTEWYIHKIWWFAKYAAHYSNYRLAYTRMIFGFCLFQLYHWSNMNVRHANCDCWWLISKAVIAKHAFRLCFSLLLWKVQFIQYLIKKYFMAWSCRYRRSVQYLWCLFLFRHFFTKNVSSHIFISTFFSFSKSHVFRFG